jgi:hypothetical protein
MKIQMYSGKNSIYEGMSNWAKIIYPSNNKWNVTSDRVSNILLSVRCGIPNKPGHHLRMFNKFVACDLLYKHLSGKQNVTIEQAKSLMENDKQIFVTCGGVLALNP